MILASWVNRAQQDVIEYLQEENRALQEQMGGKHLRFTDVQRRRLAERAKKLGRRKLIEIGTLVTPDTCFAGTASSSRKGTMEARSVARVVRGKLPRSSG